MDHNWMKAAREHLGLTYEQLGDKLGMARQTVWRYERGELELTKSVRLAVERLLISHEDEKRKARKQAREAKRKKVS